MNINSILRLFNLILNSNNEIVNLNDNTKSSLVLSDGLYVYNFNIKDISYKLTIFDDFIQIDILDSNEVLFFYKDTFKYIRMNNDDELEHVFIDSKELSFFRKNDLGNDNSYSILFTVHLNGNKYCDGIIEENIHIRELQYNLNEINRSKNGTYITTTNKLYSDRNKLTHTYITSDFKPIYISDYISNELCNSGFILSLLSYLKDLIPNFEDYIKQINKNVLNIKNSRISKKISNQ